MMFILFAVVPAYALHQPHVDGPVDGSEKGVWEQGSTQPSCQGRV